MLAKKLIPAKFMVIMIEIIAASFLLATKEVYPSENGTTLTGFTIGSAMVLVFSIIQLIFTFIGVNIFNLRIHFENFVFDLLACLLLGWFCFAKWPREYIWYIWGFLCLYPFFNELFGMISMLCHNSKKVYEQYSSER